MKSIHANMRVLSAIMALCFFAGFPRSAGADNHSMPPAGEEQVVVFHFNDLHGRIERLARMATVVRQARRQHRHVYLLCAGDNFSGNPVVDQAEPRGEPVLKLLNTLGVQAMVLGNHEFDYGQEVLQRFIGLARFPMLCANMDATNQKWAAVKPFVRMETKEGPALTILGLIQIEPDSGIPSAHPSRLTGLTFRDPLQTATLLRGNLTGEGVRVALSHLGYASDRQLAEALPELDVIVGGHSHTVLESGVVHNGVLIVQAGAHGDYLGRIDLYLHQGAVSRSEARLIQLDTVEPAADMLNMVREFESNPVMERVLATLPRPLADKTELGNWICDLLCRRLNLDIAFHNAGGVRIKRLNGAVRVKDIYQMLPFQNLVVQMQLFPREIRDLIETDVTKHGKVDLLMSGLRLRVKRTAAGKIVKIELMDDQGRPLDENRRYAVGFNSYIASSYHFKHDDAGKSLEVTTAAAVIGYLESGRPVIPDDPALRVEEELLAGDVNAVAARSEDPLETGKNPFGASSAAGNLMADAMREQSGSQVALFPSRLLVPGIRIAAGSPIGTAQVRAMYKHAAANGIQVVRINSGALQTFLLERVRYRKGFDLQLSGLSCSFYRDKNGAMDRVECRLPDGSLLKDNQMLRVAFCDYDFDRYYKIKPAVVEPRRKDLTLESVLLNYLGKHPRLDSDLSAPRMVIRDTAVSE
ncbi:MAG: 5'-nucleotidase C-terminal domain-containing protein [Candidatus Aminicenantes bacterium]|nr:5'-nucleotidase C-terminal domain-containing protein [Candidatus Aminicenantes bacterium]